MPWQDIQLAQQSYRARSLPVSAQRLVNMYLEANPQGAKGPVALYQTPGLKPWATVGDGPIRGMIRKGALLYVVSGGELYRVTTSGAATLIGSIAGTHNVRMTRNASQIMVATENEVYTYDGTNLLQSSLSGINGVAYLDGYGILTTVGDEKLYITALDDFETISALDFSSADALPDTLVGCIVDHRELWLFGEESIEIWYNSGNASFPLQRVPSGFIERGCTASGSIAKHERSIFWLGDDLHVYMAQGYQPIAISTAPIEELIRARSDFNSAEGFAYNLAGRTFYALSFAGLTIEYDTKTGLWHERVSPGESRWRAQHYARFAHRHIVGDFEAGNLYELDLATYTDNGAAVDRIIDSPPIYAGEPRVTMSEFYVDAETGVGLDGGVDGSDPYLSLSCSDDGGRTWDTPRLVSLGAIGSFSTRPTWNKLGQFRARVMRLQMRAPVKLAIAGCKTRLEVGQ
jgi:hypothetical protein